MRWPWNPAAPGRGGPGETPLPYSWGRRHWRMLTAAAVVVVLIAGGIGVWMWKPWNRCGPGLSFNGSVCVGLALGPSGFKDHDPLSGLEHEIAADNDSIKGPDFVTIVYLDDLAPDPASDSVAPADLKHRIEGAITAEREANHGRLANGTSPKIKLLLANYGAGADDEQTAVNDIIAAQPSSHIAAVTGIGQSLEKTRKAIADLSAHQIVTVGSIASADDMNTVPGSKNVITNFFRVTSTDMDEATAAADYVDRKGYKRVLLIQDKNSADDYVGNLGNDVKFQMEKHGISVDSVDFQSPVSLYNTKRSEYMDQQFKNSYSDICNNRPDLIYFAGRGVDLRSFLDEVSKSAPCENYQPSHLDVLSGDDAVSMGKGQIGKWASTAFNVSYTAVATGNEWAGETDDKTDSSDYQEFAKEFHASDFRDSELIDGHAIMTYDAVLTAADAARHDEEIVQNPSQFHPGNLRSSMLGFDCANPVPGAGGRIAFPDTGKSADQGDPSDKPIPIMQIEQNGQAVPDSQQPMEWPAGSAFGTSGCGKYTP